MADEVYTDHSTDAYGSDTSAFVSRMYMHHILQTVLMKTYLYSLSVSVRQRHEKV